MKGKAISARVRARGTDFRACRAPGIPLPSLSNICHAGFFCLILLGLVETVFSYPYINLICNYSFQSFLSSFDNNQPLRVLERVRVPYALEILPREFIQAYVCIKKLGPYKEDVVL